MVSALSSAQPMSVKTFSGDMMPVYVVFGVLGALFLALVSVSATLFVRRRKLHPIGARQPFFALLAVLGAAYTLWFVYLQLSVLAPALLPCEAKLVLGYLVPMVIGNLLIARGVSLWFRHGLQHEKIGTSKSFDFQQSKSLLQLREVRRQESSAARWFYAHRVWAQENWVLTMVSLLTLLEAIGPVATFGLEAADAGYDRWDESCPSLDGTRAFYALILGVFATGTLVLVWKLRHDSDHVWIQRELALCAWTTLLLLPAWFLLGSLEFNETTFPLDALVSRLVIFALWIWSFAGPVYASYAEERQERDFQERQQQSSPEQQFPTLDQLVEWRQPARRTRTKSLQEAVQAPRVLKAFRDHLEQEFAVENLLFCKDVAEFKSRALFVTEGRPDESDNPRAIVNEMAERIYDLYMQEDAILWVNLQHGVAIAVQEQLVRLREQVEAAGGDTCDPAALPYCDPTIFDAAFRVIWRLMERDSFPRFLRLVERSGKSGLNGIQIAQLLRQSSEIAEGGQPPSAAPQRDSGSDDDVQIELGPTQSSEPDFTTRTSFAPSPLSAGASELRHPRASMSKSVRDMDPSLAIASVNSPDPVAHRMSLLEVSQPRKPAKGGPLQDKKELSASRSEPDGVV